MTCVEGANQHLDRLSRHYRTPTRAQDVARGLMAELAELRTEDIFEEGLHEFLSRFIRETANLAGVIHDVYLSGDAR